MAIDEVPTETPVVLPPPPQGHSHTAAFVAVFVVLAMLVIGEIYSLSQLSTTRQSFEVAQAKTRSDLSAKMDDQISQLEKSNAQMLDGLKQELESSSKSMGMTQSELRRARASVAKLSKLQADERQEAEQLKSQLATKADAQQVGALSQDVTSTKTDLGATKTKVDTLSKDLGMARSELGTLIATNHNEIEALRKMGDRDYFEFAASKNQETKVAGVGLMLKKTNVKKHRFNLTLLLDDMEVRKDNRTVDEPIFFSVRGSKKFYELVVNKVDSDKVTGYISTPKGAAEVAAR
ncbi:MAG TPA: hypothetical protein VG204_02050 [Terriglobia bacterium]|nr:hypothetical protein [Terriglobia bacterium]